VLLVAGGIEITDATPPVDFFTKDNMCSALATLTFMFIRPITSATGW
jgi:hypothetical protein